MSLELGVDSLREDLLPALRNTFQAAGGELRLDLPQEWSLFWKLKDGETRVLVAHPATGQWVGTLALERSFADQLILKLESAAAGESLRVGSIGPVSGVSNLDLVFKLQ